MARMAQGPYDSVIIDSLGNLYGTTSLGGELFLQFGLRLRPWFLCCGQLPVAAGRKPRWFVFSGGDEGLRSLCELGHGLPEVTFYGTTEYGGARGLGTVFELQ